MARSSDDRHGFAFPAEVVYARSVSHIYLDANATTPASPAIWPAMQKAAAQVGNASSAHISGRAKAQAVDVDLGCIADLIGCSPAELTATSGSTESNNIAIRGAVDAARGRNVFPHVAYSAIEHSSVIAPVRDMVRRGLCEATEIPVGPSGIVDVADVAKAIRRNTVLVAVMSANNETSTIQPIAEIYALCRGRGVLYLCDLSQSLGKVPFHPTFDLASASGHKLGMIPGIGVLYKREGVSLVPPSAGGTQQKGLRPGTVPAELIAGLSAACKDWRAKYADNGQRVGGLSGEALRLCYLRDNLLQLLRGALGDDVVRVNGAIDPPIWTPQTTNDPTRRKRLFHSLNITLIGVCPISLGAALRPHVDVSASSACRELGGERSHVLEAIGAENNGADIRLALPTGTTQSDVQSVAQLIATEASKLMGVGCPLPSKG